jgi:hypothetical protein
LNSNIRSQIKAENDAAVSSGSGAPFDAGIFVDAMVVSRHFWPMIHGRKFKLHSRAVTCLEQFSSRYSVLKAPRELEWKVNLGLVELDLVFAGVQKRTFRARCVLLQI